LKTTEELAKKKDIRKKKETLKNISNPKIIRILYQIRDKDLKGILLIHVQQQGKPRSKHEGLPKKKGRRGRLKLATN
jgi:hypothetical protein